MADVIEADGVEPFLELDRSAAKPPATVGHPDTAPHVSPELLPSVLRGAALSDLPTPDEIARIDVPTTVLAWVEDPAHPLSTAEALVDLMPHATLQVARTPDDVRRWPGVARRRHRIPALLSRPCGVSHRCAGETSPA